MPLRMRATTVSGAGERRSARLALGSLHRRESDGEAQANDSSRRQVGDVCKPVRFLLSAPKAGLRPGAPIPAAQRATTSHRCSRGHARCLGWIAHQEHAPAQRLYRVPPQRRRQHDWAPPRSHPLLCIGPLLGAPRCHVDAQATQPPSWQRSHKR